VHVALLILCLPAILPVIWMLSTALKSDSEVLNASQSLSLSAILPKSPQWSNFPDALRFVPFGVYLRNTLILCAVTVFGTVVSSAIVAYGFARIRFAGSSLLFGVMIATMALPGQVTMIPVFALFRWLGWYGSYLPLMVPAFFGSAFYIFLLTQFFKTIPEELAESARLDGAREWTVFTRVVLPLAKPALATCALFQFLGTWNDFMGPLLYLNDPGKYTLAYGLQQFYSSYGSKWALLMAAATVVTAPIVLLFFLAQRTFVQGISTTGGRN
jgi:multiple sugar transport system permease protein